MNAALRTAVILTAFVACWPLILVVAVVSYAVLPFVLFVAAFLWLWRRLARKPEPLSLIVTLSDGNILVFRWQKGTLEPRQAGLVVAYWCLRYGVPVEQAPWLCEKIATAERGLSVASHH